MRPPWRVTHFFFYIYQNKNCMRKCALFFIIVMGALLSSHAGFAQRKKAPADAIKQADLKRDLFLLAGDHFRGREKGTPDELKASMWLAEEVRKAGLEPAGDDGTFFQFFNLIRERVSNRSSGKDRRPFLYFMERCTSI